MGCDMIVNLTRLPGYPLPEGVKIKRVFPADKPQVLNFIGQHFSRNWVYEAEFALMQRKCFIAAKEGQILGFACYDASALGFFGPIGVREDTRGSGVGKALLLHTLQAMKAEGYGYGVIGWVGDAAAFYRKTVNATFIPGGEPENSVYADLLMME